MQVGKMLIKLAKHQVGKMASLPNGKLANCQVDKL